MPSGIRLKVHGIDQTRIVKVLLTLPEEEAPKEEGAEEEEEKSEKGE